MFPSENSNTEYKRSWNDEYLKWICGFANAQGGTIYIGIADDRTIVGLSDTEMHRLSEDIPNKVRDVLGIIVEVNTLNADGKNYLAIVTEPSSVPINYRGQYHYRSGATKQELKGIALQEFILKKMGKQWDDVGHETATMDAIDPMAIQYLIRKGTMAQRIVSDSLGDSPADILDNLHLIDEHGRIKNAALLLFSRCPQRYFAGVQFKIGRFGKNESDLLFQDIIEGSILQMADRVIEVLKSKYLISPIHYEGMQRIEPLEIPEEALREILYNAIIHKRYGGAPIQMRIYNDHIELWNEGTLPDGYTIETLMGIHSSRPRNLNIAEVFYRAGFVETWGRGFRKIRDGFQEMHLPMPIFQEDCGGILVTIQRPTFEQQQTVAQTVALDVAQTVAQDVAQVDLELSALQNTIYNAIANNNKITRAEIAKVAGVSIKTIERAIKKMPFLKYVGSGHSGYWSIIRNQD